MSVGRLSRNKKLKVPKILKNEAGPVNTTGDLFAIKQAGALAENKKFNAARECDRLKTRRQNVLRASGTARENPTAARSAPHPAFAATLFADVPDGAPDSDICPEETYKIPADASELMVITKAKKLGAYVLAVTQKSPAKFRSVFVARLQNFCLDIVADLLGANFIRMDGPDNKKRRENLQIDAIVKLKMLGYVAMLAQNAGCILMRQYKQISIQIGETVNLATAWKKSDDEKYKEKQNKF